MLTQSRLRFLVRWSSIGFASFLGAYVYSQLHAGHPVWTDAARYGMLPVARLSSAWVWQQGHIAQWFHSFRASTVHA